MSEQDFQRLEKKIDRLTTLLTKIAKTLHLVPVTAKEEKEIQITQRRNQEQVYEVDKELTEMSPDKDQSDKQLFSLIFGQDVTNDTLFGNILADDVMPQETGGER